MRGASLRKPNPKRKSKPKPQGSWLRRHSGFVVSSAVGALIAGGVAFGYWYFAQRPIENQAQEQTAQRAEIRDLYQDSRRLIVAVRERLNWARRGIGEYGEMSKADLALGEKALRQAIASHNRAYGLMQNEEYAEARVAFRRAQKVLNQCQPCQAILE
jgi:predicted negative regulator of RcsB-dependent stress response